jgi:hypothetical protein
MTILIQLVIMQNELLNGKRKMVVIVEQELDGLELHN